LEINPTLATGAGSFSIVVDLLEQAIASPKLKESREVGCPVAIPDFAGAPIDKEALFQADADGTFDGPDSRLKR
jgi:hypothetical protein